MELRLGLLSVGAGVLCAAGAGLGAPRWFWALAAGTAVSLLLYAIIGPAGDEDQEPEVTGGELSQGPGADSRSSDSSVINVNIVAADSRPAAGESVGELQPRVGTWLEVRGVVTHVTQATGASDYVVLMSTDEVEFLNVRLCFPPNAQKGPLDLRPGDELAAFGRIEGADAETLSLGECEIKG
jgi:hypothetical protein